MQQALAAIKMEVMGWGKQHRRFHFVFGVNGRFFGQKLPLAAIKSGHSAPVQVASAGHEEWTAVFTYAVFRDATCNHLRWLCFAAHSGEAGQGDGTGQPYQGPFRKGRDAGRGEGCQCAQLRR